MLKPAEHVPFGVSAEWRVLCQEDFWLHESIAVAVILRLFSLFYQLLFIILFICRLAQAVRSSFCHRRNKSRTNIFFPYKCEVLRWILKNWSNNRTNKVNFIKINSFLNSPTCFDLWAVFTDTMSMNKKDTQDHCILCR